MSWKLTNSKADSVPDSILIVVIKHPDFPVSLYSSTKGFLFRTEPGMNYTVIVYAFNQDGRTSSPPTLLSISPSGI